MISTQTSKSSLNSEADFVTIDKSDLYPDAVSSHFLLCWLTALVDCFYVMVCVTNGMRLLIVITAVSYLISLSYYYFRTSMRFLLKKYFLDNKNHIDLFICRIL
jgi:hypothetical protein